MEVQVVCRSGGPRAYIQTKEEWEEAALPVPEAEGAFMGDFLLRLGDRSRPVILQVDSAPTTTSDFARPRQAGDHL